MKFISTIVLIGGMLIVSSCGPSDEERAAAEKKVQDSTEAAKVQMEAAMEAARQQLVEDSLAIADSASVSETPK